MSDGRLWFDTKIDNSQIAKDLKTIENQIRKSQESISKAKSAKLPLETQLKNVGKELESAKSKLDQYQKKLSRLQQISIFPKTAEDQRRAISEIPQAVSNYEGQRIKVEELQKEWDSVKKQVKQYDEIIERAETDIERNTEKAVELNKKLHSPSAKMAEAMDKAEKSSQKFGARLSGIVKSALIFNVISSGLRAVMNYMNQVLQTNSEYTAQLAKLKGALLTAFQPIYEYILPGLLTVLKILTAIVQVGANILSFFSGKTATQSAKNAQALNKQAEAISNVGSAAEEAEKQLMGFDEINRLESTQTSSGGGSGASSTIEPDFSGIVDMEEDLTNILDLVGAIAAGLLTWKIASAFTDSLSTSVGLALAVAGAFLYAFNWADAFANGISWDNLLGMISGMIILAVGLGLAFGTVGAAVGLLIGSVGLIVAAFAEFARTGEVTDEMLYAIAVGFLGIGIAISLLTGSWIPLAIGAIIGLVTLLGLQFDGVREAIGTVINWVLSLWETLVNFFNWLASNWSAIFGSFSVIGGETVQTSKMPSTRSVPHLATGAVIPPNREFMAVLGDQTHGNNIEAPESLIRKIVREETAGNGSSERVEQLLEALISVVEGIEIGDETIGKAAARYTRRTSRARGV